MNTNSLWRRPNERETNLLITYFDKKYAFADNFFMIWTGFGIFGTIGTVWSIIQSIIEEPEAAIFTIISGVMGLLLIYLFFVKLGSYIKNVAIKREVSALKNHQVWMCTTIADNKSYRIREMADNGRGTRYNYYINTHYPKGQETADGAVSTSRTEFDRVNVGDQIVVVCCSEIIQLAYMTAFKADWFDEADKVFSTDK